METAEVPKSQKVREGNLITAVQAIARHFGRPSSETVLFSGIPFDWKDPDQNLIIEMFSRIGLDAKPYDHVLSRLVEAELPALIILKSGHSFIIRERRDDGKFIAEGMKSAPETELAGDELDRVDVSQVLSISPVYLNKAERAQLGEGAGIEREHWLAKTLKPFWKSYATVALAALFINLLGLASPLFVMNVYDRILPNEAISTLWVLGIGMGIALIFDFLLKMSRSAIIDSTGRAADLKLSYMLFDKVLNSQLSVKSSSTGEFANRVGQYEFVREFFTSNTIAVMIDSVFVFIFVGVIYWIAGWLAIIPLVAFILAVIIGLVAQQRISSRVARAANEAAERNALLIEGISTIETIKSLRAEAPFLKRWNVLAKNASRTSEDIKQISASAANSTQFIQQMVSVAIIIGGAYTFAAGNISTGGIIATVILSGKTIAPLSQISLTLSRFRQALLSLKILNAIMEQPDDRPDSIGFVNRKVASGKLDFREVDFTYPQTDFPVFSKLTFSIKPGEKVGIIGKIGSGKTTLGKLISGLYQPTGGRLLVDGVDIRQYHPFEVRKAVGFAGQSADLFSGSIKENLLIANPEATDEEIIDVCRKTGVDDFASRHPRGYDMPVGERGDRLSGGQKQTMAIARLLLTQPKIVFLDEPSGAMDLASERLLIQTLRHAFPPETTLIIATHRSSMLDLVDRIIVLDNGRVIGNGPKDMVMAELAKRAKGAGAQATSENAQPKATNTGSDQNES